MYPEAKLRVRISNSDAHYAGNLVAGAKILELFGDVATQLTIQYDGDEGLLRAYDNVEFLQPVHGGDFIEVIGKITQAGNTSRKISLQALKIISPVNNSGNDSAADILENPILVAKASATCVVTKEKQRKKH